MKQMTMAAVLALVIGSVAGQSAFAADILGRGGLKDEAVSDGPSRNWSGFVVTGMLGYASRDVKADRIISGEGGFYCLKEVKGGPDGIEGNADDRDLVREEIPLIGASGSGASSFDSNGLTGGAEIGYRRQMMGGWVGEVALGIDVDANSKVSRSFATEFDLKSIPAGLDAGTLTGAGSMSFEKQGDVYATLRMGHTLGSDQRLLVGLGGGVVAGRFNLKGAHDIDGDGDGLLSTRFDDTETAIGWVVEAFGRYKLSNNLDFGILGQYKDFGSISSSGKADPSVPFNDNAGLYAHVNDKASADVTEWDVKATLTYTFD